MNQNLYIAFFMVLIWFTVMALPLTPFPPLVGYLFLILSLLHLLKVAPTARKLKDGVEVQEIMSSSTLLWFGFGHLFIGLFSLGLFVPWLSKIMVGITYGTGILSFILYSISPTSGDTSSTEIKCVVGYPGSGKSTVATYASAHGYTVVEMGEQVKQRAYDELGENATSNEIGEWATKQREKHGKEIVAKWTIEHIQQDVSSNKILIDGVRSIEEYTVFEEEFGDVEIIHVTTSFKNRLKRLQERGRDGEETFTAEDLNHRDKREAEWGVAKLLQEKEVTKIPNSGTLDRLEKELRDVL